MNFACPYCGAKNDRVDNQMAREYDDCCPGKPSDMACIPDNKPRNFRNDIKGCEKFRFSFGGDEMAMNAEMGLYLQFDETDGIPENCPGLEKFTIQKYLNSMEILFIFLAAIASLVFILSDSQCLGHIVLNCLSLLLTNIFDSGLRL